METQQETLRPLKVLDLLVLILVVSLFSLFDFLQVGVSVPQNKRIAASSIQLATTPLEILSPNGNEKWGFGSVQEIRWRGGRPDSKVNVYLVSEGGQRLFRTLLASSENDGSEYWIVDVPAETYKIQMEACPGCPEGSNWDSSDIAFAVTENKEAVIPVPRYPANESLVFFSPHGGETYQPAEKINVQWFGGYETWQLTLTAVPFWQTSTLVPSIIAEGVLNDGNFEWMIPSYFTQSDYYLKIECSNCEADTVGTSAYLFFPITIKTY